MTGARRACARAISLVLAVHSAAGLSTASPSRVLRRACASVPGLWTMVVLAALAGSANGVRAAEPEVMPQPVGAEVRQVAGVPFASTTALDGQTLHLQGAGVRAKMIVKVYAMGLYVPAPVRSAEALLQLQQPHRLRLVLLRDVDARRLSDGLAHAMLDGLAPTDAARLEARVHHLAEALLAHRDVRRGDEIWLDYRPASGTRVSVAGEAVMPDIEGADFNAAMLSMWVGDHAPDERLKAVLLGLPPP